MSTRDGLIDFLVNYGGRCRDCADEDGFCPQTGIGCGQRRKAVELILGAIDYGTKHGFAAGYRLIGPGELDRETIERCAQTGYRVCAETRHVTLGDKVAAALRSLQGGEDA